MKISQTYNFNFDTLRDLVKKKISQVVCGQVVHDEEHAYQVRIMAEWLAKQKEIEKKKKKKK